MPKQTAQSKTDTKPVVVSRRKLSDFAPDSRNANKGTKRGSRMIEDSLRNYGAGRSILLDRNGAIIAGNKTAENAGALGMDDVLVVKTNGRQLVAVQRTDLVLDSPKARVVDLFGGSGSTLIACEKIDRQALVMELEPGYTDVILQRFQEATGKVPTREDGKTPWRKTAPPAKKETALAPA